MLLDIWPLLPEPCRRINLYVNASLRKHSYAFIAGRDHMRQGGSNCDCITWIL